MIKILNAKGEPVVLNAREKMVVNHLQQKTNALGYEIDITTLTTIMKRVVDQKFFELPPADYVPIKVGEGSWSSQLVTYRSFNIADDFETGNINTGVSNGKLAEADAAVDSVAVQVINWGKTIGWTLFDIQQALKAGNWDLITAKEKSRKRNWDLGIQKIAFLGSGSDTNVLGLLTQSDVTSNTAIITELISGMTAAEFNTFVGAVYEAYRSNAAQTAKPTHFIIPEADYNGLINFPDATYPLKNRLQLLEEAFKTITQNPNFKILPNSYGDLAINAGSQVHATGLNRYVLLNYDEDSVRMDIPVDYINTLANSVNSFQFNNVGYGQYTGVKAYRPKEMLYFDWS